MGPAEPAEVAEGGGAPFGELDDVVDLEVEGARAAGHDTGAVTSTQRRLQGRRDRPLARDDGGDVEALFYDEEDAGDIEVGLHDREGHVTPAFDQALLAWAK
jgi:hypothetical protein